VFFGDVRRQVLQENARLRVEVLHGVGDDSLDVYSLNLGLIKSLGSFDHYTRKRVSSWRIYGAIVTNLYFCPLASNLIVLGLLK